MARPDTPPAAHLPSDQSGTPHVFAELDPPYSTIVADPPWHYDDAPLGDFKGGRLERFLPYSTMSAEEISDLPVGSLAAPGAHLYLWTTTRYLWDARQIITGWGFDFAQVLVWCKEPKGLGPGGTFASTVEFVLTARRGNSNEAVAAGEMIRTAREAAGLSRGDLHRRVREGDPTGIVYRWEAGDSFPNEADWLRLQLALPALGDRDRPMSEPTQRIDRNWFVWPRGRHSEKPDAFLDIVERVSPGPYVELFARAPRLGWDSWGKGYEIGESA